jgi:hypothetical protein
MMMMAVVVVMMMTMMMMGQVADNDCIFLVMLNTILFFCMKIRV